MKFDEKTFLWAMTTRASDCKTFSERFEPEWLNNGEYGSLLSDIFAFFIENRVPPSFTTLHSVIKDREPEAYKNKVKSLLEDIQTNEPDLSEMIHVIKQADSVAVIRSLQKLIADPAFLQKQERGESIELLGDVHRWLNVHLSTEADRTYTLDEAISELYKQQTFQQEIRSIPIGIECVDEWCGGGLRPGQLGLLMAPTGHGKSVALVVAAQKIASIQEVPVWYITNELTMEEATERFLARTCGVNLTEIIREPLDTMSLWKQHVQGTFAGVNLWLSEVNREMCADDIEAEMMRRANLTGIRPRVICLDFMERMKPNGTGYSRDQSWNWLGAIAQDLSRLAKRHRVLIWTACQTNRAGLVADTISEEMIQGSIKHLQEATAMVGMTQDRIDGDHVFMKWKALKMRQSEKPSGVVFVKCDLATMTITNERWSKEDVDALRGKKEPDEEEPKNVLAVPLLTPAGKQKKGRIKSNSTWTGTI